jgi:hypothetical protein
VFDAGTIPDDHAVTAKQELLDAERHAALRAAFAHLPPSSQQLLALLTADPPMPYAQISAFMRGCACQLTVVRARSARGGGQAGGGCAGQAAGLPAGGGRQRLCGRLLR